MAGFDDTEKHMEEGEKEMKGIERCGECGYYNWNRHRCTNGANKDTDPRAPFFADCPLKDAQPVVHGKWIPSNFDNPALFLCSKCNCVFRKKTNFCPNCGAKMEKGQMDE